MNVVKVKTIATKPEVKIKNDCHVRYSTGRSVPPTCWVRTAPNPLSDVSACTEKGRAKIRSTQDGFPAEGCFNSIKQHLAWLRPLDRIWGPLAGEVGQGAGQVGEVWDKLPIVPRQPQEPPHLVLGPGARGGSDAAVLPTCGRTFPPPRWNPRYWISLRPITHFFGLAVSPARLSD